MVGNGWSSYSTYVCMYVHAFSTLYIHIYLKNPHPIYPPHLKHNAHTARVLYLLKQFNTPYTRLGSRRVALPRRRADGYERVLLRRVRRGLSRLGEGVAWVEESWFGRGKKMGTDKGWWR